MSIHRMYLFFIIKLLLLKKICASNDEEVTTVGSKDNCREYNRLIVSDKYDKYDLVEVSINEIFILECHYCSEYDNNEPKIWYKIEPKDNLISEVKYGMHNNSTLNRITLSLNHSLIVNQVKIDDAGIYYCQSTNDDDVEFNFIVDVIFDNEHIEKGDLLDWTRYHDEYIMPINKLFEKSNDFDFKYIRDDLKLTLQLITEWGPWSSCEVCGRPPGLGIQESIGYCRLKIKSSVENYASLQHGNITEKFKYFMTTAHLSCKSYLFKDLFPELSNITGELPNFLQTRRCDGICGLDAKGMGWTASKGYKFRKMFVLAEKAHLTVVCPEATLENVVIWRRNGKVLKRGQYVVSKDNLDEPHVMVDSFGTLYLTEVTMYEEGNYTCQVDDIKMQQVRIMVVSKTTIITRAFLRHMGYLAIVLSLTSFCYCSGLYLAWRTRHTFKTYEDCVEEDKIKAEKSGTAAIPTKKKRIKKAKKNKNKSKKKSKNESKEESTENETDEQVPLLKYENEKSIKNKLKRKDEWEISDALETDITTENEEDKKFMIETNKRKVSLTSGETTEWTKTDTDTATENDKTLKKKTGSDTKTDNETTATETGTENNQLLKVPKKKKYISKRKEKPWTITEDSDIETEMDNELQESLLKNKKNSSLLKKKNSRTTGIRSDFDADSKDKTETDNEQQLPKEKKNAGKWKKKSSVWTKTGVETDTETTTEIETDNEKPVLLPKKKKNTGKWEKKNGIWTKTDIETDTETEKQVSSPKKKVKAGKWEKKSSVTHWTKTDDETDTEMSKQVSSPKKKVKAEKLENKSDVTHWTKTDHETDAITETETDNAQVSLPKKTASILKKKSGSTTWIQSDFDANETANETDNEQQLLLPKKRRNAIILEKKVGKTESEKETEQQYLLQKNKERSTKKHQVAEIDTEKEQEQSKKNDNTDSIASTESLELKKK